MSGMNAFEISQLIDEHQRSGLNYLEFLRVPALSMGIYVLPANGTDPQQPHTEAEVYYVLKGRASIIVGYEDRAVEPGSLIYVDAGIEHRFHTIREELTVLVFFAPPEHSQG